MALTIYGSPRSRTMRTLWVAEELGLDYEHVPYAWDDAVVKSDAFLEVTPAGAVPAIVDDGFALGESLAINLYLAKKYGSDGPAPLYPSDPRCEADAWRWTLWAQGHLEPWLQQDARLSDLRKAGGDLAVVEVNRSLETLERVLEGRAWLGGLRFNVADLNVAGVLSPSRAMTVDFAAFPRASDWLKRCYARPAAVAARAKFAAA